MRLNEITNREKLSTREDVEYWIHKNVIDGEAHLRQHTITVDENLNVNSNNHILEVKMKETKIPIKIGRVTGIMFHSCPNLTSLKGLPTKIRYLWLKNCPKLVSLQDCPRNIIGDLQIMEKTGITSLEGIGNLISRCSQIDLDEESIKIGGIGLLLIKNLGGIAPVKMIKTKPFNIIRKYLHRKEDIYECQAELIENGFEEYAKL